MRYTLCAGIKTNSQLCTEQKINMSTNVSNLLIFNSLLCVIQDFLYIFDR